MINKIKNSLFRNRNTRQTVAKNVFWLTAGQIGSRLFRALIIVYAARVLGAAEYGVFAYVLGLAGFFTVFADIGVNATLTREASKKPEEASQYFATIFWIKITLLLITAGLVIFVAPLFSKIEGVRALLPFMALLTAFDGLRELSAAFFRARERMELEAIITTVTNVAVTIFGFLILRLAANAESLAITYALSAGAGTIVGAIILRRQFAGVIKFFRKDLVRPILEVAWPIALLGILAVFMLQTDILMLGFFKTSQDVGLYSAGQKIVQILYTLPAIFAVSIFPVLSRLIGKSEHDKTKSVMEQGMSAVLMIAIPITIGGIILAKNIILLLYGAEYLPAVLAFQVLILTPLIVFPGYPIGQYIFSYDGQRKMVIPVVFGSLGNIVFNALLIPPYGIVGSAIATLIAQSIYIGLQWRLAKKLNNFYVMRHLKKIALAGLLMGFLVFMLNRIGIHVIATIILSGGAYFGMLYLLKERVLVEIKNLIMKT